MATKPMIIGLYSPVQQSGKSTVASTLVAHHGYEKRGFSLALKRMVIDLMNSAGLTPEQTGFFMDVGKEDPIPMLGAKSFRNLCQTIGTDWGRKLIDKDLWTSLLLERADNPPLLVIDDVRFENEFDAIKAKGGEVWRIHRAGAFRTNDHPSEGLLEKKEFDVYLENNSTMDALFAAVRSALKR